MDYYARVILITQRMDEYVPALYIFEILKSLYEGKYSKYIRLFLNSIQYI